MSIATSKRIASSSGRARKLNSSVTWKVLPDGSAALRKLTSRSRLSSSTKTVLIAAQVLPDVEVALDVWEGPAQTMSQFLGMGAADYSGVQLL
jgi:hypothetical protein